MHEFSHQGRFNFSSIADFFAVSSAAGENKIYRTEPLKARQPFVPSQAMTGYKSAWSIDRKAR